LNLQFQERQKTESGELIKLRDRLEELEKEINERTQNRDDVIKRRLDQLLSAQSAAATNKTVQNGVLIFDKVPIANKLFRPKSANAGSTDVVPGESAVDAQRALPIETEPTPQVPEHAERPQIK
jgi:hypothetical protein